MCLDPTKASDPRVFVCFLKVPEIQLARHDEALVLNFDWPTSISQFVGSSILPQCVSSVVSRRDVGMEWLGRHYK